MEGWIKIHRQLADSKQWLSEPFTRGQAWVDLIMLANHKDGFIRTAGGHRIEVKRGHVGYSEDSLAKRWRWSRGKVRRFFKELEEYDNQIVQLKSHVKSLISIVNYNKYQLNSTTDDTTDDTTDGQLTIQLTDTNKNDNNDKNDKELFLQKTQKEILAEKYKSTLSLSSQINKSLKLNNLDCIEELLTSFIRNNKNGSPEKTESEAHAQVARDCSQYESMIKWINIHAPRVNKMKEPLTIKDFIAIRTSCPDKTKVGELLKRMHNYKDLNKNVSTKLTLENWYRRD